MADYYTKEVITSPINLTPLLEKVLVTRGAEIYREGNETVLDHLVAGQEIYECCVTFSEGWTEGDCGDLEDFGSFDPDDFDDPEELEEFKRLADMDKPFLFHEILKVNPDQTYIELQASWSCNKMRLDGFGGSSLHVTKKGYLYVTTTNVSISEDGIPEFDGKFVSWDDASADPEHSEQETSDEQTEAA